MSKTKVIAGFPGVGKSTAFREAQKIGLTISDSDSSKFPKDNFPANYVEHIKSLIGKVDIIMVSTHKEVLDALEAEGIEHSVVAPERELKDEYIQRYKDRGSPEAFIKLLTDKWDNFIDDIEARNDVVWLGRDLHLSDVLGDLRAGHSDLIKRIESAIA